MTTYFESFDDGPGGWYGYQDGPGQNKRALEWSPGSLTSRSPWWIDYNHAPPGIGYFHMLFCLNTFGPQSEEVMDQGGSNRYVAAGLPTDFTRARVTAGLRGELRTQGARMCVLLLNVVPMGPIDGDMHKLRPNREYPVWRHELPEGYVTLDSVQIEFR